MRILHLVSYPLFSGPAPGTLALAQAQARLGHRVWFVCDQVRGNFDGYEESIAPHLVQSTVKAPACLSLTLSTKATLRQHMTDWWRLRAFLRSGGADVVHTHLSHDHVLVALARSSGVTHVRTLHSRRAIDRRWGQGTLLRCADGLIVRCAAHRLQLMGQCSKPAERITSILGSVDSAAWRYHDPQVQQARRLAVRAAFGIPPTAFVLGHVALMAHRGQEQLLAALQAETSPALASVHVLLVGDGPQAPALKAYVRHHRLAHRVHFTGYLTAADLRDAYTAMDACLVLKPGNDAAVRAALEAMAAGLLVLAPAKDALAETVDADTGIIIDECSRDGVAAAIITWLKNPQAAKQRRLAGAQRMQATRQIEREAVATVGWYAHIKALGTACP